MPTRRRTAVNRIIHALPPDEAARIESCLEDVDLAFGDSLCEAGRTIGHAVFPLTAIVSLFATNAEGGALEVGIVGRDGLFGASLAAGISVSTLQATVQGEGVALRIEARRFRRLAVDCPALRARAERYAHRLTEQIALTAVCNGFHSVEARSARWMLSISDQVGSDTIALTQALLADMLGVLRPAVSHAASALARHGYVTYSRGSVRIVDRAGLAAMACSCYPLFAKRYRAALRGSRDDRAPLIGR